MTTVDWLTLGALGLAIVANCYGIYAGIKANRSLKQTIKRMEGLE